MKGLFKPLAGMGDDSIIHIIHDEQDRLEAICDYGYEDLVPLTAADWWQFAPWLDMKDAPIKECIIILCNDGNMKTAKFSSARNMFLTKNGGAVENGIKWLPLPTGDL